MQCILSCDTLLVITSNAIGGRHGVFVLCYPVYTQKLQMRSNDIFGFDDGDLPIQCGDFRKGTSGERDFLEKAHHKITL